MNNIDWSIENTFLIKDFGFQSSKSARKFSDNASGLAEEEQISAEIGFLSGKTVNIKIPIKSETNIGENEIRLANLINKIG